MIDIEALPEVELQGEVAYISPVTSKPDGVLLFEDDDEPSEYEIRIDVNIPERSGIRSGMSCISNIIIN